MIRWISVLLIFPTILLIAKNRKISSSVILLSRLQQNPLEIDSFIVMHQDLYWSGSRKRDSS